MSGKFRTLFTISLTMVMIIVIIITCITIVKNCTEVKETQVTTAKSVIKETTKVLDSLTNVQHNETIKKDSANVAIDTMSATNKRKRAKEIFKRRQKQRLGFAEGEDCECRKLLREERQLELRRPDRRLYQDRQRADRKKQSVIGRKDSKQISGRQTRKLPDKPTKSKQATKVAKR